MEIEFKSEVDFKRRRLIPRNGNTSLEVDFVAEPEEAEVTASQGCDCECFNVEAMYSYLGIVCTGDDREHAACLQPFDEFPTGTVRVKNELLKIVDEEVAYFEDIDKLDVQRLSSLTSTAHTEGRTFFSHKGKAKPVPSTRCRSPLRDFSVGMTDLNERAVDIGAMPVSIRMSLAFLQRFSPRDIVRDDMVVGHPILLPPQRPEHIGRRTVVLDLDETLVHCSPTELTREPDLRLRIDLGNLNFHVYIRPFADVLLFLLAKCCEVVVFTASTRIYADKVLDYLDPDGRLIVHRLYRQHCTEIAGCHFKDMRILGRRPEDVVLLDNNPLALGLTPENGMLCKSWFGIDLLDEDLFDFVTDLQDCFKYSGFVPSIPKFLERRYGLSLFLSRMRSAVAERADCGPPMWQTGAIVSNFTRDG